MGYRKIPNFYKPEAAQAILPLVDLYVTEKIHGTSAHVAFHKDTGIRFFSGGIKHELFLSMLEKKFCITCRSNDVAVTFDCDAGLELLEKNIRKAISSVKNFEEIIFYGEAYGGKCQKMSHVYGPLNFIVFEVNINDVWTEVPNAEKWAALAGFEFVYWKRGPATVEWLDEQRDKPSCQALRNGMGEQSGEGIVIRPLDESFLNRFGERILCKHKCAEFSETKTPREIDPEKQKIWTEARETAEEWVTPMRLTHVLDKLVATKPGFEFSFKNMRTVIGAMTGDVRKESGADGENPEIIWSNAIQKSIGTATANLFKAHLNELVKEIEKENG